MAFSSTTSSHAEPAGDNTARKAYSIYDDTPSLPRKTILVLHDDNVRAMLLGSLNRGRPVAYVQQIHRDFRKRVQ